MSPNAVICVLQSGTINTSLIRRTVVLQYEMVMYAIYWNWDAIRKKEKEVTSVVENSTFIPV
jgi:hypothetical protein